MRYYDINTNEHEAVTGYNGAVNTNISSSDVIQPIDHQATLVNTAVTHTGVVVANGGGNTQSSFVVVPDGMSEFVNTLAIDGSIANVYTHVYWSEDGTTTTGMTSFTTSNSEAFTNKASKQWYPIGGSFYKVSVLNGDAAPHTCSANIKFRP